MKNEAIYSYNLLLNKFKKTNFHRFIQNISFFNLQL